MYVSIFGIGGHSEINKSSFLSYLLEYYNFNKVYDQKYKVSINDSPLLQKMKEQYGFRISQIKIIDATQNIDNNEKKEVIPKSLFKTLKSQKRVLLLYSGYYFFKIKENSLFRRLFEYFRFLLPDTIKYITYSLFGRPIGYDKYICSISLSKFDRMLKLYNLLKDHIGEGCIRLIIVDDDTLSQEMHDMLDVNFKKNLMCKENNYYFCRKTCTHNQDDLNKFYFNQKGFKACSHNLCTKNNCTRQFETKTNSQLKRIFESFLCEGLGEVYEITIGK